MRSNALLSGGAETTVSLTLFPRAMGIYAEVLASKPDVVHLFWGHYPSLIALPLLAQRGVRPRVSIFLGAYDLSMNYLLSRFVARRADVVVTHAHANRAAIEGLGVTATKIQVVHRGIDLRLFSQSAGAQKKPGSIIVASRLIPEKAVDIAIDAFLQARTAHPDL